MPILDGFGVCRELKKDTERSTIPIIAVTASALNNEESLIREYCTGYIRKPISLSDLQNALMEFIPHSFKEQTPLMSSPSPRVLEKRLSKDWIELIIPAIELGHIENISQLIEEIPSTNPSLYTLLKSQLASYRFDAMKKSILKG